MRPELFTEKREQHDLVEDTIWCFEELLKEIDVNQLRKNIADSIEEHIKENEPIMELLKIKMSEKKLRTLFPHAYPGFEHQPFTLTFLPTFFKEAEK